MLKSFGDDYANTWSANKWNNLSAGARNLLTGCACRLHSPEPWQLAHLAGPGEGRPPFAEVCFA